MAPPRPTLEPAGRWTASLVVASALLLAGALPAGGQSVLERTANLSGGWVGTPGTIQFNFLHHFWTVDTNGDGTGDKIVNSPSFLLAAPLPGGLLLGAQYASNSTVHLKGPAELEKPVGDRDHHFNEWEILGRWRLLSSEAGSPVDLSLTGAVNAAAGSADGELSVGLPAGPLRVLGVARAFSDAYGSGDGEMAFGGGAVLRVSDGVALAGDVVSPLNRLEDQEVAWSAGLQLRVPTTPHTLSLHAANTRTATLQGSSVGGSRTTWGFEFTIPFTLSRYFGGGGGEPAPAEAGPADRRAVTMTNSLRYGPGTLRVRVGETVTWRNTSDLIHTVTADPEKATDPSNVSLPEGAETFDSGNLQPGETFSYTFQVPGEYLYFCVPHEAAGMVGRVVVTP